MKILQINKFYYRRRGAETYMLDLIDVLEQHGHEVGVFAMDHPENLPSKYSQYFLKNIEYGDLSNISIQQKLKSVSRVLWSREAAQQLEKLLKVFKPDIAHIHNIYHQISPSILPVLKRHGIPVIHTLHDYKLIAPNYNLLAQGKIDESSKGHKYYNVISKKGVKNSYAASALAAGEMYFHKLFGVYEKNVDCFISPSEFLKQKVLEWKTPVKRIEVIPNFIDTSSIKPSYDDEGYILYVGGLYEEKGVDVLLDSIKQLKYSCSFRIAGSGPEQDRLKQQAKGLSTQFSGQFPVWFLGQLSKADLLKQLSKCLAVVVPSRWYENYPYSVIEAFAMGKPVIAANIGGLPELVQPQKTGALFEPGNVNDLARVINNTLANKTELKKLGTQARQWVEQELNPEKHYQRIYALYKDYTT